MSVNQRAYRNTTQRKYMKWIKEIIPKEQLDDYDYDALLFNRLEDIRKEKEGIRNSGKIPFGKIELEILQFFLAHHLHRLNGNAFKAINSLFTDLGYLGYQKHPLRARQKKESLRKKGVSPEELVKNFRRFDIAPSVLPVPPVPPDDLPLPAPDGPWIDSVFDLQDALPASSPQGVNSLPVDSNDQASVSFVGTELGTLSGEEQEGYTSGDDLLLDFHAGYQMYSPSGGQSYDEIVTVVNS